MAGVWNVYGPACGARDSTNGVEGASAGRDEGGGYALVAKKFRDAVDGEAFADADIQKRKVLFREAALEHVTILRQIDSILKRKSDHSISDEFFHDILDEHFSEVEVQRQFETAMNWGRYAEIFDYDRESGKLMQTEAAVSEPIEPTSENQNPYLPPIA